MTFLEAVNRVLRTTGIIKGDDDNIATFTDIQHNATLNLAIIAIQSELNSLIADRFIPYERSLRTLLTVVGVREYDLGASFARFWKTPLFHNQTTELNIYEIDEDRLRQDYPTYKEQVGMPQSFYFTGGNANKIGLFPIPDAPSAGLWDYEAEMDVSVTLAGDVLPFIREQQAQVFCNLCARHFLILYEEQPDKSLLQDSIYMTQKSILLQLLNMKNARNKYGVMYA